MTATFFFFKRNFLSKSLIILTLVWIRKLLSNYNAKSNTRSQLGNRQNMMINNLKQIWSANSNHYTAFPPSINYQIKKLSLNQSK